MNKRLRLSFMGALLITVMVFISGCTQTTGTSGGEATNLLTTVGFLVVIFALFYFVMVRPQRKRQKQHEAMIRDMKKGDKVITAGGIYGVIDTLNEDNVILKVESGATIRVARGSVFVRKEQ
jgi:preprotein translocase subunit YajC